MVSDFAKIIPNSAAGEEQLYESGDLALSFQEGVEPVGPLAVASLREIVVWVKDRKEGIGEGFDNRTVMYPPVLSSFCDGEMLQNKFSETGCVFMKLLTRRCAVGARLPSLFKLTAHEE